MLKVIWQDGSGNSTVQWLIGKKLLLASGLLP